MRILVTGSRYWTDKQKIKDSILAQVGPLDEPIATYIVHGGANGADSLAGEVARECGFREVVFRADWKRWGRAAGPMRNAEMLDRSDPDVVLAFPIGKSSGTRHMMRIAGKNGYTVINYGD